MVDLQQMQEDISLVKGMVTVLKEQFNQAANTTPPANEVMNVQQAADLLNLTTATIYGMVYEKRIPFSKPTGSGRLYFLRSELMEWVKTGRKFTNEELDEQVAQQISNRRTQSKDRKKGQMA